jgi:hypothetical protein
MNFIVGALLYHANEVMAFWLFVSLIEDCEMRDIYMHGLPGLFKHSHIINTLVTVNLEELSEHFVSINTLAYDLERAQPPSGDVCLRLDLRALCLSDPSRTDVPLLCPVLQTSVGLLLLVNSIDFEVLGERAPAGRRALEHSKFY